MMNRLFTNRSIIGLWLAVCLVAVVCAASYSNLKAYTEVRKGVEHTREVRVALSQTLSSMQDAETGQRGFLLTGDVKYLKPYTAAVKQIPDGLAHLQQLMGDNPAQQHRITDLKTWAEEKLTELALTIQLRRDQGLDAALPVVVKGEGKRYMDGIRTALREMSDAEELRLTQQQEQESRNNRATLLIIVGGNVALFLLLSLAAYSVQHELLRRRQAEVALRRSEQHYATTLRGIGDAVIATDTQGRITFMNGVAEQLTGWRAEEAGGQDSRQVFRIVNEETRDEVESPISRVMREGTIVGLANHTILISKEGEEVPIDDSGAPIRDDQGDMTGIVLVFRNITERRSAETEREAHLAEIEELNARLQRAMAESHHRIKNHLQMLASLVDIQTGESEMVSRSAMTRLNQHIRSLASLHDILTSEAKFGRETETISMQEAIGKLVPMLQTPAGERQIVVDVEEVLLPFKQAGTLMLLVNELVSNAIKHGKGEIELSFGVHGDMLRLEVCDDGPGFPPDFDPEKRANIGIELIESLSRWDLSGQTAYENRAQGGARVVITVPILAEAVVSADTRESRQPSVEG